MRDREAISRLLKLGNSFCILPWVHLHVATDGNMLPCCQQSFGSEYLFGNLNEHTFTDLWQGEAIKKFRLNMLNDEVCVCCKNCKLHESANIRSLRKISNSNYQQYIDWVAETDDSGYSPNAKPVYWDIRFSNACNLKCRTCDSNNSSGWYKDKEVMLARKYTADEMKNGVADTHSLLKELDGGILSVEEIYFAGGEPLLMKENLVILEKLDDLKRYDVRLLYNTNVTLLNNEVFLKLWKKFSNLTFLLSMDGNHARGEYLRSGSQWSIMESNLRLLRRECPHVKIIVNYTVSVYNIFHLADFHKELVEKDLISVDELNLNILNEPETYNIRILPREQKELVVKILTQHIAWIKNHIPIDKNDIDSLIRRKYYIKEWFTCMEYMSEQDWQNRIPEFMKQTAVIDAIRNENCLDVFPELKPIFDYHILH